MRKYLKWLVGFVALLLVGLFIWLLINFYYFSTKRLPPWEKEKVEQEFFEGYGGANETLRDYYQITWYEDNGYAEEEDVWRYIGKYGDCYAFMVIGNNIDVFGWAWEGPYPIEGLSREVYYPTNEAYIMLYHTKKSFTRGQIWQREYESDAKLKMYWLRELKNREEWLTDTQLERLTRDVEKLAKEHT